MDKRLMENHLKLIDGIMKFYDEDIGMFYEDFDNPNAYHTKLRKGHYHGYVRNSELLLALFDGGREEDFTAAKCALNAVLDGQCKCEGDTFGIWPYFREESLEQMDKPDWNMANFNGINLLQLLIDHSDKLDEELLCRVRSACRDACVSIMRRDVTITYTNVAVMDIYMTIVCGELLGDAEIFKFGIKKLKHFYCLVIGQNSFEEHNSTPYNTIMVNIFGLMLQHIKDEAALKMINELNAAAWKMIGEHYHVKTGEWTGAQTRSYSEFLDPTKQSFFEKALDFKIHLTDEKCFGFTDMRYDVQCPQEYQKMFTDENKYIEKRQLLSPGFCYPCYWHPRLEMLYLTPDYSLGSFHLCGGWNQRRNVVAYMGTKEKKYCIRYRILHDGYDYCSGFVNTVQEHGAAVSMTTFQTDRGDTHNDLDKVVDATIKAKDLRVRYQITSNADGAVEDIKALRNNNGCTVDIDGIKVEIGYAFAEFSGETPYVEIGVHDGALCIDMVLVSGEERAVDFKNIECAAVVSWIAIGDDSVENMDITKSGERLSVRCDAAGKKLGLSGLYKPEEFIISASKSVQYIDGKRLEDIGNRRI